MPKKKTDKPVGKPAPAPVNLELVRQLEAALDLARQGELVSICHIGTLASGLTHFGYSFGNAFEAMGQLDFLKSKVMETVEKQ
jgi:hypothetical protein